MSNRTYCQYCRRYVGGGIAHDSDCPSAEGLFAQHARRLVGVGSHNPMTKLTCQKNDVDVVLDPTNVLYCPACGDRLRKE